MTTAQVAFLSVASAMVPRVSRRVAVIGGGSGGVVAARFMKRAGHRPVLFEAGSNFGGVWADSPTNDVVYKNLNTNLPTIVMQSPDLDFEASVPSYINKPQLGHYIEQYAQEFGVAPLAKLGARVTSITPVCSSTGDASDGDERWEVQWTTADGEMHADTFEAVVVANGHYEEPYAPELPGQREWLAAEPGRSIMHSRQYDEPSAFANQSVLIVGGRSSGVDISRELRGVAKWVYVLEKKCTAPITHEGEAVTHVPLGTRLCADGHLRMGSPPPAKGQEGAQEEVGTNTAPVPGPPVERIVLATGYVYSFPFLDESTLGMRFRGRRSVTPLFQHLQHARRPSLGFVGVQLAVPCPIPFFECQAAYLAEAWARPPTEPLSTEAEREAWVVQRLATVAASGREQDLHYTSAEGGSAWSYMRELLRTVHATRPPTADGESWIERDNWEQRLSTVEAVYNDRGARYPKLPWHDDAYRKCEYSVDWASGEWSVDVSRTGVEAWMK